VTAATVNDTRALSDMTLFDNDTLKCPYHYDKTLRDTAPVYQDPSSGVYMVSTYALVREVHKNPKVFSNEFGLAEGSRGTLDSDVREAQDKTYNLGKGTLLTVDAPVHDTYRNALKSFFLAPNIANYRPWIEDRTNTLISKLPFDESFEFVEHFARPLPLSVIMHVLGIPPEMHELAFKWTVDNVIVLSQTSDKETLLAAHAGLKDEYDWFASALNQRRETPREDLLSLVAHLTYEDRPLTIEEQLSHCTQFLVAGNETTTATLAEGMRQLCLNPEQQQKVRDNRSLIPNLVDESLRLASPTSSMWRVTKADYNLGGTTIPKGSMVLLRYFSSNHDEAVFEKPMDFDITRSNGNRHIAFGFGTHVCIGQHLSKLEMTVAWEKLFDSSSNFSMTSAPESLEYMPNILLRGLEQIEIVVER
jgi:cytochrome P450 family 142 subfamily A polypeptide 1